MRKTLVLGSRGSELALWQARHIKSCIENAMPTCQVDIKMITTSGDLFTDRPLLEIGGKALFVKEIEEQLLSGDIDLAVHSMKDVPAELPTGLQLTAIPPRENPYDVFLSKKYRSIAEMPAGALLGTSSLRRSAQALAVNTTIQIHPLRGNVGTRLKKMEEGVVDATILAQAGINRLEIKTDGTSLEAVMVPAVGQGSLGIETRSNDDELNAFLIKHLHDATTAAEVLAERTVMKALGADCHAALGALGRVDGNKLTLTALAISADGQEKVCVTMDGLISDPVSLGTAVANEMKKKGALECLSAHP